MEHLVTFKSGRTKVVSGKVVLFDGSKAFVLPETTEETAYLNIHDIESIIGRPKKDKEV